MKLGTQTGSITNYLLACGGTAENVKVGDPATILCWTDNHAGTVIKIETKKDGSVKEIHVQRDNAVRIDKRGMSECQDYEYSPNPNGSIYIYRLRGRKNPKWQSDCEKGLRLGVRREYYDFSF